MRTVSFQYFNSPKLMGRYLKLILTFMLLFHMSLTNAQHQYPDSIAAEAQAALSYYPELSDIQITFKFKKKIKKSTMQAQPTFGSFFRSRKNRGYVILISEHFKISDTVYLTANMPKNIMIGWLGHELGHVMDYQHRSKGNLIGFGIKYLFSDNHIKEAERAADSFAVSHGLEEYILATKNFILNHADLSEQYKSRIRKYYLSPEEIMQLVEERDAASK